MPHLSKYSGTDLVAGGAAAGELRRLPTDIVMALTEPHVLTWARMPATTKGVRVEFSCVRKDLGGGNDFWILEITSTVLVNFENP